MFSDIMYSLKAVFCYKAIIMKLIVKKWDRYWKLTILEEVEPDYDKRWWAKRKFKCKCDCWNEKVIRLVSLRSWHTKTCSWCDKKCWCTFVCHCSEVRLNVMRIIKPVKYWWTDSKFHWTYYKMKHRCENKNNDRYYDYGWRWIKCEWNTFFEYKRDIYRSYLDHIELHWKNNTSIDRIDNNWNYSKSNCKWSTRKEQSRNTRRTILYKWRPIIEICEELNISYSKVTNRLKRWWDIERAIYF